MISYRTLRRTVVAVAVSAGFIAAAAGPASAGPASAGVAMNHSQPLCHLG
jgi:hypothetical protein